MNELNDKPKKKKSILELLGFTSAPNISVVMQPLTETTAALNVPDSPKDSDWNETDSLIQASDSENSPVSSPSSYASVLQKTAESHLLHSDEEVVADSVNEHPLAPVVHHSANTLARAQKADDASSQAGPIFKTGICFLALSGVLTATAIITGIYPILAISAMLAVIGTVMMLTAYGLNDEKKNGSLIEQTFPKGLNLSLPTNGFCFGR